MIVVNFTNSFFYTTIFLKKVVYIQSLKLCHYHYEILYFAGGCNIEGEDDSYDFGSGAGFYLDATEEKWKKNYRMFSYVTQEVNFVAQTLLQERRNLKIFEGALQNRVRK